MARVKGGNVSKNRRRKVLKEAKGYFGSKHRLYKTAQEQVFHSGAYAFRDRRQNKRNFRKLWITRINAACRENEISYSKFINGLAKAGIEINRKMLSEMAIDDPKSFTALVETAKKALNGEVKDIDYIYESGIEKTLDMMLPMYLEDMIYGIILDAKTSEHSSRMNSMRSASDNADEVISKLQLLYNRARQNVITTELIDIIGGANAIGGKE